MTKQEFKKIENEFKKEQKRWESLKIGQSVFETGYEFDCFEIIIDEINIDERYIKGTDLSQNKKKVKLYGFYTKEELNKISIFLKK